MLHEHLFQPGHVRAFQAVTTQMYGDVTLASCLINGKPGVAIVLVEHVGEGKVAVMPLWVAITDDLDIVFQNMTGGGDDGEGGGPKRGSKAAAKATQPTPDVS